MVTYDKVKYKPRRTKSLYYFTNCSSNLSTKVHYLSFRRYNVLFKKRTGVYYQV